MKILKRILILCMVFLFALKSDIVYAYDHTKPFDPKDVTTWTQGSWAECHQIKLANGDGHTIARSACSYFATSYALVKAGLMDPTTGTAPIDFIKEVNKKGGWDASWGHFDVNKIGDYYPEVTCEEKYFGLQQSGMTRDEALAVCKNFYNEGKFVLICVRASGLTNGHYVFLDGYDENGMMIVGDSGKPTTTLQLYLDHNVQILYCHVYSIEGVKCNELASIYSENVGQVTNKNGEMSEEEQRLYGKVRDEYDLEGMGQFKNTLTAEECLVVPEFYDNSYLSTSEKKAVSDIKGNVDNNRLSWSRVYHIALSFIGICCILYGVLLILAYFLDYNNVFIEVSMLGLITFGRFRVVNWDDIGKDKKRLGYDKERKITYLTLSMVLKRSVVLVMLGMFLVSGILSSWILNIIWWIKDMFGI